MFRYSMPSAYFPTYVPVITVMLVLRTYLSVRYTIDKDFSILMILDRFDSILFYLPVCNYILRELMSFVL